MVVRTGVLKLSQRSALRSRHSAQAKRQYVINYLSDWTLLPETLNIVWTLGEIENVSLILKPLSSDCQLNFLTLSPQNFTDSCISVSCSFRAIR